MQPAGVKKQRMFHVERVSATTYYGRRSPGQVVLVNGMIRFHGAGMAALKFERRILARHAAGYPANLC